MRVRVYYNLRRKCLSVMDKTTRKVIDHVDQINLYDVQFVVSQKGIERIRRQKRKAVVAFVEGDIEMTPSADLNLMCDQHGLLITGNGAQVIRFDPYKWDNFVLASNKQKVRRACFASIKGKVIKAYHPV